MSSTSGEELPGGHRLVGRWVTEGAHPLLPGEHSAGEQLSMTTSTAVACPASTRSASTMTGGGSGATTPGSASGSPVYYTPARYTDLYWVSSPGTQHALNLADRPEAEIVIFGSTAPVGQGEAVYLGAVAAEVPDQQLEAVCPEAFRAGAHRFTPAELRGGDLRLYVAHVRSCEVHVPGGHPVHGRGIDSRQPADPTVR